MLASSLHRAFLKPLGNFHVVAGSWHTLTPPTPGDSDLPYTRKTDPAADGKTEGAGR